MGLNTSHDCWHGPYSSFMRFRERLWQLARPEGVHIELMETVQYMGPDKKENNIVDILGEDNPLVILFCHSDCDGEIQAADCEPLADAMEKLLEKMPPRATYDDYRPATERFIAGLRRAAAAGEDVVFS